MFSLYPLYRLLQPVPPPHRLPLGLKASDQTSLIPPGSGPNCAFGKTQRINSILFLSSPARAVGPMPARGLVDLQTHARGSDGLVVWLMATAGGHTAHRTPAPGNVCLQ